MLKDKIIRHSSSPCNSPIILIKKDASKKEKWKLVVDFRKLSAVTVGDSYPLRLISEILLFGKSALLYNRRFSLRISSSTIKRGRQDENRVQ
jgi:hypothetical protein